MANSGTRLDADQASRLVLGARAGSADAFERLFQLYGRRVYNLALRSSRDHALAEDLCQEVWLRVYRELGSLQDLESFAVWLYRLTSRVCIDAARRRRPQGDLDDDQLCAPRETPEERLLVEDRLRLAWEALGALPVRQHIALYLRQVEGMSYAEIGAVLDAPVSAVETLLFRARRAFARSLREIEAEPGRRCRNARAVMAALLDGEASALQKHMLRAHAEACAECRSDIAALERAGRAYAGIPLAPLPLPIAATFAASALPASPATLTGAGKLAALLLATGKLLGAVAAITTLVAGGAAVFEPGVAGHGRDTRSTADVAAGRDAPVGTVSVPASSGPPAALTRGEPASAVFDTAAATDLPEGAADAASHLRADASPLPGDARPAPEVPQAGSGTLAQTAGLAGGVVDGAGDFLNTTTTGATELLAGTLDNLGAVIEDPGVETVQALAGDLAEDTADLLADTTTSAGDLVSDTTGGLGEVLDAAAAGQASSDSAAPAVNAALNALLPPVPEQEPESEDVERNGGGALGALGRTLLD
jgi:RNA polymerase sigma-70 factor (ECF subfamily)